MKNKHRLTLIFIISAFVFIIIAGLIGLRIRRHSGSSYEDSSDTSILEQADSVAQRDLYSDLPAEASGDIYAAAPEGEAPGDKSSIVPGHAPKDPASPTSPGDDKEGTGTDPGALPPGLGSYTEGRSLKGLNANPTYMAYYGRLNLSAIQIAKLYDIVILHPKNGDLTREQVKEIQDSGTRVLGYISIGEDLRTASLSSEDMLKDERFTGDGSGPRTDPRKGGSGKLNELDKKGTPSSGGTGYASYYLDDNDHDGKPDRNPYFSCAYTNIGDPAWHKVLENMTLDSDGVAGIKEIVTTDHGRGLGCDGIFMDTVDTAAPNSYTLDTDDFRTRFEWTASGLLDFTSSFKKRYPDKYLVQNRGLFYYNKNQMHYSVNPGKYIDYLMYESFRLDSSPERLFNENHFLDNLYVHGPMIAAEAGRPDGFSVLSLGYGEGPSEYDLTASLLETGDAGRETLMADIHWASEVMGFSHYITNGSLTLPNSFVLDNQSRDDITPPEWSSVYNPDKSYPASPTTPRYGIGTVSYSPKGLLVKWDVALDRSGVDYYLYYQEGFFDYENDPDLKNAVKIKLEPQLPEDYGDPGKPDAYPYQQLISHIKLSPGKEYYFAIRAQDRSPAKNPERNTYFRKLVIN